MSVHVVNSACLNSKNIMNSVGIFNDSVATYNIFRE